MEAECLRMACGLAPVFEALVPYFTFVAIMEGEVRRMLRTLGPACLLILLFLAHWFIKALTPA